MIVLPLMVLINNFGNRTTGRILELINRERCHMPRNFGFWGLAVSKKVRSICAIVSNKKYASKMPDFAEDLNSALPLVLSEGHRCRNWGPH